jgi:hypothetical protein
MTAIQQKILDSLSALPAERHAEVLDFVEFLKQRYSSPERDLQAIEELCGKYSHLLSGSEEFASKKQEEIEREERKWLRR